MPNKFNVSVRGLTAREVAGMKSLCQHYRSTPSDLFRFALEMLGQATAKEIANEEATANTGDGMQPATVTGDPGDEHSDTAAPTAAAEVGSETVRIEDNHAEQQAT